MAATPFVDPDDLAYFRTRNITLVNHGPCELFLARNESISWRRILLERFRRGLRAPLLIWTHEPRFNTRFVRTLPPSGAWPRRHFMNVYTGDVHIHNVGMFGWAFPHPLQPLDPAAGFAFRHRRMAAILTHRTSAADRLIYDGRDIDLNLLRCRLAAEGHSCGCVDIYGEGWPSGVARELSREGNWHERKIEILSEYHFNLAFENTNFPGYCTEKIWDSIRGGCLPVYFGQGNRIYDLFPPDSFIDYAELDSPAQLFELIQHMPVDEFIQRLNRCIEAYNRVFTTKPFESGYQTMLENTANRIVAAVSA